MADENRIRESLTYTYFWSWGRYFGAGYSYFHRVGE